MPIAVPKSNLQNKDRQSHGTNRAHTVIFVRVSAGEKFDKYKIDLSTIINHRIENQNKFQYLIAGLRKFPQLIHPQQFLKGFQNSVLQFVFGTEQHLQQPPTKM